MNALGLAYRVAEISEDGDDDAAVHVAGVFVGLYIDGLVEHVRCRFP